MLEKTERNTVKLKEILLCARNKMLRFLLTGVTGVAVVYMITLTLMLHSKKIEVDTLKNDIVITAQLYNKLNHDTQKYAETYHFIRSAGATVKQSQEVILYAQQYAIDAKILASLIRSESMFKEKVAHTDKNCKGVGGINTRLWGKKVGIEAVAKVLSALLEKSKGNYREALHYYKSYTPKGLELADRVLEYVEINK